MIWTELFVDRTLSDGEVVGWIADTFSISSTAVVVMPEEAIEPVTESTLVLCETVPEDGEFPMRLMVFVRRKDLESHDPEVAIANLCRSAHVRALTSDDTMNPYRMMLINVDGTSEAVHLDVNELDENGRYVIAFREPNVAP